MKKFRKLLALMLVVCMVCAVSTTAWAEETEIEPFANTACPYGNGIHQMLRKGTGSVITTSGQKLINMKPCWQCTNCYDVIITSDDPTAYNGIVGNFATWGAGEPISQYGCDIRVNSVDYCGSKTMEGFRFFNNLNRILPLF